MSEQPPNEFPRTSFERRLSQAVIARALRAEETGAHDTRALPFVLDVALRLKDAVNGQEDGQEDETRQEVYRHATKSLGEFSIKAHFYALYGYAGDSASSVTADRISTAEDASGAPVRRPLSGRFSSYLNRDPEELAE